MSSKGRIVVIDDEVNAAAALETLLKEDGYDVTRAHDARAGLQLVERHDPDLVLTSLSTMDDLVAGSLAPREFLTLLVGIFAAAALGLASIGLYGVLSRLVRAREREIGIRRAVGADARSIMRLVLREGMTSVVAGAAAGLLLAGLLGRALGSVLFGVTPGDLPTYLVALALLLAVALVACYLPARRAARVDPTVALSSD